MADGFIEWERLQSGKTIIDKHPFRFDLKSGDMMGMAGIWVEKGFVIITTEPNSLVEKYQERMAVILRREDEKAWLDANTKDIGRLVTMLAPFPSDALSNAELSKAASNSKNKTPDILKPIR
jgi:putative SOS response-associated peptidase YedK